ncbi:MAG: hypothetical protein KF768_04340 [Phycisphaeraceae bacterium]|nr:hypothetical protein [Phycisphaeraceae bacterium]
MNIGRRSPIGLDVGSRWIKAVQVARTRDGERIVAATRLRRSPSSHGAGMDSAEADALLGVLHRQGFNGQEVVLSAPHDLLIRHGFDLPPRESGAPVAVLARAELARIGRCVPAAMEMCWWETPSWARAGRAGGGAAPNATEGGGIPVYALGMAHESATALLDGLEESGWRVVAVDAPTTAAARAVERGATGGRLAFGAGMLLVEIGWSTVCISAFAGGVPVYERLLDERGLSRLADKLRTDLKVTPEVCEHLVESVGLTDARPNSLDPAANATDRRQEPELLGVARKIIAAHADGMIDDIRASVSYASRRFVIGADAGSGAPVGFVGGGCVIPGLGERLSNAIGASASVIAAGQCVQCLPEAARAAGDPSFVCALGLALHDGSHPGDLS